MKLWSPSDEELEAVLKMKSRAEKRAADSIADYLANKRLVDGDLAEWENIAPIASLTGKNTIVVRNAIGQNVRDDTDRLMPTDSRWNVEATEPCIYDTEVDPMTGQEREIEIDNVHRSYIVRAVSNFVSKNTKQSEEAMRVIMDSLTGDNGYMLVTSPGTGADESHTVGFPAAREDDNGPSEKVGRKIKRGKVLHGGVNPYLPVFLREPPTNIFADPDASTDKEVNCWFRWVCRPLVDVKKDKRYENTTNLKANYNFQSLRYRPKYDKNPMAPGRNQSEADHEGQQDMLGFWEYHYRVSTDKDSIDGYEYRVMSVVEQGNLPVQNSGSSGKPVCIRHEPYAQDIGGFAIKRFQATIVNDDFYGYSAPIRYSRRANATENAAMSMYTSWVFTNRTRRLWNKNVLSADDIQLIEEGEANDNILLNFKADQDMSKMVTALPASPIPPELVQLIQMLRSIANESSGRSANQRGQFGGGPSATEVQVVEQQTRLKTGALANRFSRFMAEVQEAGLEILRCILPKTQANGRKWTIPDPENPGKFLSFDGLDLDARYTLEFDLTSMQTDEDSVTVKQGNDLLSIMAKTPPQLLMAAEPLIMQIALALGPVWESRVEKVFENIRKGNEETANPDKEHILMLQGDPCQPQDDENFMSTIPRHEAQIKNVSELPPHEQEAWLRPLGQGPQGPINPLELLVNHVADSRALASAKGINVPGGPKQPGQPGSSGAEKGSGPGAMRPSQATPTGGDLGGGAGNTMQGSLGRV